MEKKICVTGGSGGAGHAVIAHLLDQGFDCVNLDIRAPQRQLCPFIEVDMTNYAAVHAALQGCDALVHFAGQPKPDATHWEAADRFNNNTSAVFNAFNAARDHGIDRIVWASSETVYGYPFRDAPPPALPLREDARKRPETGYGLSKLMSEAIAEQMANLYELSIIGLRMSHVHFEEPGTDASYENLPTYWDDITRRRQSLWGYLDHRDCARAVQLALECDLHGAHVFNISAAETLMTQPTKDLVRAGFPETSLDPDLRDHHALLSCEKAKDLLGWEPQFSWRMALDHPLTESTLT